MDYWDKKNTLESILKNDSLCIGERLDLVEQLLKVWESKPIVIREREPCPLQHYPTYPVYPTYPPTSYDPGTFYCTSVNMSNALYPQKDTLICS